MVLLWMGSLCRERGGIKVLAGRMAGTCGADSVMPVASSLCTTATDGYSAEWRERIITTHIISYSIGIGRIVKREYTLS